MIELEPLTLWRAKRMLRNRPALAAELDATLPDDWPNEDFRGMLASMVPEWEARGAADGWTWLVLTPQPRRIVGEIGAKGAPDANRTVEVGYGLVAEARGKGLMSAAMRAFLTICRERGVRRVLAETLADNVASHNVLLRAGFVETEPKDGYRWWALTL